MADDWGNDPLVHPSNDWGNDPLVKPKTIADRASPAVLARPSAVTSFFHGLWDEVVGGAQMAARGTPYVDTVNTLPPDMTQQDMIAGTDQFAKRREADYQAARGPDAGTDWWRIAGDIAQPMNYIPAGSVGRAGVIGRLAADAVGGAMSSSLSPVTSKGNFLAEKLKQIAIGGAFGSVGGALQEGVAQAVSPLFSAAAQRLAAEGVHLTPGMGAGSAAKAFEDKATSIPLMGDAVARAQRKAVESFNAAAINRVLAPIGERLSKGLTAGRDAIAEAQAKVSKAYDDLLPNLTFVVDAPFKQDMVNLAQLAKNMPRDRIQQLKAILKNTVGDRLGQNGVMSGHSFKDAESELTQQVNLHARSPIAGDRQLGDALKEVRDSMREALERNNPLYAGDLKQANSAYAALSRVEDASMRRNSPDGVFTPSDLLQSIKTAARRSGNRKSYARGDALMQDLAEDAQLVIGNRYPDSGTAGRLINMAVLGGIGYEHNALLNLLGENPLAAAALAGATIPYLIGGRGRNALADMLRASGRVTSPAIGMAGASQIANP